MFFEKGFSISMKFIYQHIGILGRMSKACHLHWHWLGSTPCPQVGMLYLFATDSATTSALHKFDHPLIV